jgi:hypothetical protein
MVYLDLCDDRTGRIDHLRGIANLRVRGLQMGLGDEFELRPGWRRPFESGLGIAHCSRLLANTVESADVLLWSSVITPRSLKRTTGKRQEEIPSPPASDSDVVSNATDYCRMNRRWFLHETVNYGSVLAEFTNYFLCPGNDEDGCDEKRTTSLVSLFDPAQRSVVEDFLAAILKNDALRRWHAYAKAGFEMLVGLILDQVRALKCRCTLRRAAARTPASTHKNLHGRFALRLWALSTHRTAAAHTDLFPLRRQRFLDRPSGSVLLKSRAALFSLVWISYNGSASKSMELTRDPRRDRRDNHSDDLCVP